MLVSRSPWNSQPPSQAGARLKPVTDVEAHYSGNTQGGDILYDITGRTDLTVSTGLSDITDIWRKTPYGDAIYSGGSADNTWVECDSIALILTRQNGCMWLDLVNYGLSGNQEFLTSNISSSTGKRYLWMRNTQLSIGWEGTTNISTGIFPAAGERFQFSLEWDPSGGVAYFNGEDLGLTLVAPGGSGSYSAMDLFAFVSSANSSFRPICDLLSLKVFPKALGAKQQKALADNPYSDLEDNIIYFPTPQAVLPNNYLFKRDPMKALLVR